MEKRFPAYTGPAPLRTCSQGRIGSGATRLFGLIGFPLGHSFSQRYFREKFAREGISDARYELFPLPDIANLPDLLHEHPDLQGLNVTIPHKQSVMPHLHSLHRVAQEVGAVNCIRIHAGHLRGYNTDVVGLQKSLAPHLTPARLQSKALVLGSGGAAQAAAWVLKQVGIAFHFVSRQPGRAGEMAYSELAHLSPLEFQIIINATPLGTYPNVESMPPIPTGWLHPTQLVYDMVYNPPDTLLLQQAVTRGCATQNGLQMLYEQAEAAWEIFSAPAEAGT